jgi:Domain of unknown function (DUF5122) beta-propeller
MNTRCVAIQTMVGEILAAGSSCPLSGCDFALARYNPADGSLDSSFSAGMNDPNLANNSATLVTRVSGK